ncbi:hypothetical protein EVAR_82300_1 [Eumeta japonica]|uniref:Uncharacterized protein n=1 Tax=Eumeta variegata TaxID=151549 RepID=A0A4C1VXW4_EUMVA|nr:hypothetical protein EVAR_82300_1 [Eumeta japonica]
MYSIGSRFEFTDNFLIEVTNNLLRASQITLTRRSQKPVFRSLLRRCSVKSLRFKLLVFKSGKVTRNHRRDPPLDPPLTSSPNPPQASRSPRCAHVFHYHTKYDNNSVRRPEPALTFCVPSKLARSASRRSAPLEPAPSGGRTLIELAANKQYRLASSLTEGELIPRRRLANEGRRAAQRR